MLEDEVLAYIAKAQTNIIEYTIEAYERVFKDKEHYYSNCSYIRYLEITRRNLKALSLILNSSFIKVKIRDYYKDRDFSYLIINYRGKIKVKSLRASSKPKV
jgi:hypothetical protein